MPERKIREKRLKVQVTFSDGDKEELEFPLPLSKQDIPLTQSVKNVLEDSEMFFSLYNPHRKSSEIVNKDQILSIALPLEKEENNVSIKVLPTIHPVEVKLHDGTRLEGTLHYFMPPQTSRVLDYVGLEQRFIEIRTKAALILINKKHILKLKQNKEKAKR